MVKETFTAHMYENVLYTQSQIDPSKNIESVTYKCPKCKKDIGAMGHAVSFSCRCGLEITQYGNALECTLGAESKKEIEPRWAYGVIAAIKTFISNSTNLSLKRGNKPVHPNMGRK